MTRARDIADLAGAADAGTVAGQSLIINGDFAVSQRGTSSTSDGYQTVDRWRPASIATEQLVHTYSQSTDAPSGFSASFKVNVDTAETTLDADDLWKFEQRIEGQNLQSLAKGTSDAKALTVSFWVKSNTTGTYICELDDRDNTRAYSQAYTIDNADTWEYKTLTYAGDTTGTLDNDNDQSFRLVFILAAGNNYTSGTLTTGWATRVDANRYVGQENLMAADDNNWFITGVKLEVGDTATPFQHESYGENLAKCQRYYQQYTNPMIRGVCSSSNGASRVGMQLPVIMRSAPSVTITQTGSTSHFRMFDGVVTTTYSSTNVSYLFKDKIEFDFITSSGLTAGRAGILYSDTNYQSSFAISAEL